MRFQKTMCCCCWLWSSPFYQSNPTFVQVAMSLGEKISGAPFSEGWSYDQVLADENKQKWYISFDICTYSFLEGGLSAGVRSPSSKHK